MTEMVLSVEVKGLDELRETVALLKELKELGAGNQNILSEINWEGNVIPTRIQEKKPWYPNDMPWVEHDGKSVPSGCKFNLLLRSERDTKTYHGCVNYAMDWRDEFIWNSFDGDNIVAYIKLKD